MKDQGSSCSASWALATAAYCESRIIYNNDQYDSTLDLAEQYFLQCTDASSCQGGYVEFAMDQATKSGVPLE